MFSSCGLEDTWQFVNKTTHHYRMLSSFRDTVSPRLVDCVQSGVCWCVCSLLFKRQFIFWPIYQKAGSWTKAHVVDTFFLFFSVSFSFSSFSVFFFLLFQFLLLVFPLLLRFLSSFLLYFFILMKVHHWIFSLLVKWPLFLKSVLLLSQIYRQRILSHISRVSKWPV